MSARTNEFAQPEDELLELYQEVRRMKSSYTSLLDSYHINAIIKYASDIAHAARGTVSLYRGSGDLSVTEFLSRYTVTIMSIVSEEAPNCLHRKVGRPSLVNPKDPVVPCATLYGQYSQYMESKHVPPLSKHAFGSIMARMSISTRKIRDQHHYIGIRLRTSGDPVPQFVDECIALPCIAKLGHAMTYSEKPFIDRSGLYSIEEKHNVSAWIGSHYDQCGSNESLIETKEIHSAFVAATQSRLTLVQFEDCLQCKLYESYPSDLRWTISSIPSADGSIERTLACSRLRWIALKQK